MTTVLTRQFYKSSFDKRADVGDLPQNRLSPRHEPIFGLFRGVHY